METIVPAEPIEKSDGRITVRLNGWDYCRCSSQAEAEFLMRMKLREAGIPMGFAGPTRGTLKWTEDYASDTRIVTWWPDEKEQTINVCKSIEIA